MTIRPRRSVLYIPGANERALEKARTLQADVLILDLEDSVAPDAKAQARTIVAKALQSAGYGNREVVVRINGLETPWGEDDLRMVASQMPHGVLVPKIETAADVSAARSRLAALGVVAHTALWLMMERPLAIFHALEISATKPACLVLGTNDLAKEARVSSEASRLALLSWLSMVVLAGRAHGVDVIDGVYNDFGDVSGFRAECEQGRLLGMDGKTLIHPTQIEACNAIFSPSGTDVAWAKTVIAAFADPRNAGRGVIAINGRMVERLHLAMAERVVALAEWQVRG